MRQHIQLCQHSPVAKSQIASFCSGHTVRVWILALPLIKPLHRGISCLTLVSSAVTWPWQSSQGYVQDWTRQPVGDMMWHMGVLGQFLSVPLHWVSDSTGVMKTIPYQGEAGFPLLPLIDSHSQGSLWSSPSLIDCLHFLHWIPNEKRDLQFSSVAQSWPTLCDPMNCSTPGLPVHHQLPEFTQTLVHRVGDTIQPPHPLSSPFPPAPNPSQHQGLFQWLNSSHEVAKVLEFQLQHQFFQWTPRTDLL